MKRPQRTPQINTLIDGYNLMFQSVKFPEKRDGPQALQNARNYFLNYVADRLLRRDRQRTCIVFDSQSDLLLSSEMEVREMQVFFATGYNSADELLHEMIESHSAPRNLTVVSSDHQVQKKANARGAFSIDSEDWVEHYLALMPIVEKGDSLSPKEALSRGKRRSHGLNKGLSPNLLKRIQREDVDLGLSRELSEQIDELMDSGGPDPDSPTR